MDIKSIFKMPKPVNITGRTSTITNSFINSFIPVIPPKEEEIIRVLEILKLEPDDLKCAYCGDKSSEWDHFRPLVKDKRPTGFISEIYNLVPSCGKCNQSKGNREWREWILSEAPRSPKSRNVKELNQKIKCLETFERWKNIKPIDFEKIVGVEVMKPHWKNLEEMWQMMKKSQKLAEEIKTKIQPKRRR